MYEEFTGFSKVSKTDVDFALHCAGEPGYKSYNLVGKKALAVFKGKNKQEKHTHRLTFPFISQNWADKSCISNMKLAFLIITNYKLIITNYKPELKL